MSLFDIFCAIWRFIAQMLSVIVETVVDTVTTVAKAAITLLADVAELVGDGINSLFGNGLGGWIVLGLGLYAAYALLSDKDDDDVQDGGQYG